MIPRTVFKLNGSIDDMYSINRATYRRFSSAKEAFVTVGQQDTGKIGLMEWLPKMLENMMANMQNDVPGRSRSDVALKMGANAINLIIGTYGDQNANKQFLNWSSPFIPEPLQKFPAQIAPDKLTSLVKKAAMIYGAGLVGISELDPRWVYDSNIYKSFVFDDVERPLETEEAFVIPSSVNKAITMAIPMRKDLIFESPGVNNETSAELGYSAMGCLSIALAEFIRTLGYCAIPCMNDTALSIPLAISAGLGQLGRNGLLITPEYGACVRLCKVLTDMPLNTDQPIDFGVTEFCDQCLSCAKNCPSGAITLADRTFRGPTESNNPGVSKWYIDPVKCLRFWQANGACCANCITTCPFTAGYRLPHCAECEMCIPGCPLQFVINERQRNLIQGLAPNLETQ